MSLVDDVRKKIDDQRKHMEEHRANMEEVWKKEIELAEAEEKMLHDESIS